MDENGSGKYSNNKKISPNNNIKILEGYLSPSECNYLTLLDERLYEENRYVQIPDNIPVSNSRIILNNRMFFFSNILCNMFQLHSGCSLISKYIRRT